MLKFIEIIRRAREYDPESGTCEFVTTLSEVYINPDYIVSMKANDSLKQEFLKRPFIDGMSKELEFTEVTVDHSGRAPYVVNVVDNVENIVNNIKKE